MKIRFNIRCRATLITHLKISEYLMIGKSMLIQCSNKKQYSNISKDGIQVNASDKVKSLDYVVPT